jgi:hypothetical protein
MKMKDVNDYCECRRSVFNFEVNVENVLLIVVRGNEFQRMGPCIEMELCRDEVEQGFMKSFSPRFARVE